MSLPSNSRRSRASGDLGANPTLVVEGGAGTDDAETTANVTVVGCEL
jgi:hypothetical protein